MVPPLRQIPERETQLHIRPALPCRTVLCTGSLLDDGRPRGAPTHTPARNHAGPLRGTRREVNGPKSCPAGRESARKQRTDAHTCTDSCREHAEVRTPGCHRHKQLSTRLPKGGNPFRCHPCRCTLLGRRYVPQGRRSYR